MKPSKFGSIVDANPAPARPTAVVVDMLTSDQKPKKRTPANAKTVMTGFRTSAKEKFALRQLALDSNLSVQELIREAIALYKETRGTR